jgi:hypothetical protein
MQLGPFKEAHNGRMPVRKIDIRHSSFLPCNRKSAIEIRQSFGGIAQLVERQLCKLEVRGSNPLASILILDLRFAISDF